METMICLKCFPLKIESILNLIILNGQRKGQIILKKTLECFDNESIENRFFYSVVCGLMFQNRKKRPNLDLVKDILGSDFYLALKEIEPDVMLDHTIFFFFNVVPE